MSRLYLLVALALAVPLGVIAAVVYWIWLREQPLAADARVRLLGGYAQSKARWGASSSHRTLGEGGLVALARELHANRPYSHFELYDDSAGAGAYLARARGGAGSPFPAAYVRQHRAAVLRPVSNGEVSCWCPRSGTTRRRCGRGTSASTTSPRRT